MANKALAAVASVTLILVMSASLQSQAPARAMRVLFIGNSLTAWNELPQVVARLAQADGQPQPLVRMVAVGGFSLEDHWHQGDARRAIADGPWDVVVLQQGPSALPESRRLLVEYARPLRRCH